MSELPEFVVTATAESVARWTIGRDGVLAPPPAAGAPLALAYFVFLRMQPLTGVSIHAALGRDPDRGLYGGVAYRAQRTPRVGETFRASSRVVDTREVASARGTLVLRTLETRYAVGGETVVTESVRTVDLPAGPPPAPSSGPRRAPSFAHVAMLAPATATSIAWATVETGDLNPLHLDASYAAARGYPAVVVPGTLIAARAEAALAERLGRALHSFDLRLHAASYPAQAWSLHAEARDGGLAFELFAGDTLRAEGRAT